MHGQKRRDVAKSMLNEFNLEVGCTYETEADMRRKEEGGTIGNPWSVLLRGFFLLLLLLPPPGRTKFVRRATVSLQGGTLLWGGFGSCVTPTKASTLPRIPVVYIALPPLLRGSNKDYEWSDNDKV